MKAGQASAIKLAHNRPRLHPFMTVIQQSTPATIELKAVEQLATDQASLKAAAGLAKPAKWSDLGASRDGALVWGECAGSGANPYRVMADLRDLGNKCTCPSRKFPCKHVLGLLWLKAEAIAPFPPADTPAWVSDWLGRRRTSSGAKAADSAATPAAKDLGAARLAGQAPQAGSDPQASARHEAAAAKRAEDTGRKILDALDALEQWMGDQLRQGLAAFADDATARCRRIAARLVDGKAAALAGRVDEMPSRLLALPAGERQQGAVVELGKLVLLGRAFRAAPHDPDIRRAVAVAETREAVLDHPGALRLTSLWEVLAEQVQTRRDGLVSQTTWLLHLGPEAPRFAMLLDFFPASAGRRQTGFAPGEQFAGELVFYPASHPLRALLLQREPLAQTVAWPDPHAPLAQALAAPLLHEPWALDIPVLLPAGRLALDGAGQSWWRASGDALALPLAQNAAGLIGGTELLRTAALWAGNRLQILAAQTPWGRVDG
jgi:hypothetical protein